LLIILYTFFMELSERFIQTFEKEGYDSVSEWQDEPGKAYPKHSHDYKSSILVTDGSITFDITGQKKTLSPGQRLDIPAGDLHSAQVGENGVIYIFGEMIEKDS
jgi:quercetin dioxygenase-like cupin family protein